MKKKLYKYSILLAILISDIAAFYLSFLLAYYTRKELLPIFFSYLPTPPKYIYYFKFYYLLFLYLAILIYHKLYIYRRDFWSELKQVIQCLIIWLILSFSLLALLKLNTEASRVILIFTSFYSIIFIILFRYIIKIILYYLNVFKINSAILSTENNIKNLNNIIKEINKIWYSGYIIKLIILYNNKNNKQLNLLKKSNIKIISLNKKEINHLYNILKNYNIDELFLYNITDNLLERILFLNIEKIVEIKYIPSFHYIKVLNLSIQHIGDAVAILFRNNLASKRNILEKKLFDIVVVTILLLLLSPIFLIIALLVKISSPGPIFYKAKRIGKDYKDIYVYKFRSMYRDADKRLKSLLDSDPDLKKEFEETFKLKNDPRVTPIGKFLRKYSLDELPQLFNVLKLELSLVGPRPIVREEVKKYGKYFNEVIKVRPGITGLWQISGRNDIDYSNRVKLDIFYIRNWSLWLDIKILFKTIPAVLKGRGAY